MRNSLLCFSALLFCVSAAAAKFDQPEYAKLRKIKAVNISPGSTVEAVIEVDVTKGFHVQANPASLPNLIPTTLKMENAANLEAGAPLYPKGKPHKTQDGEILAYDNRFQIKVPVTAAPGLAAGKLALNGKLRYQACNEKTCFFPVNVPVSIPVNVTK